MSLEVGQVIAQRYRVEAFLGRGGMAEVYKVWDPKRSVFLAMKMLSSDLAEDKVFLRRFKREADTLSKLTHPYIVRSYGLQEEGALAFILMDYVDGATLRREIKETPGPLHPRRILEIMHSVCAALDFAHRNHIVHCDLKSSNILEDRSGKVFLSDFGIARMMDATSSSITMAGAGTPNYMAPEQIRGESPIPQTDIYALGVLLFEMVTDGERPFTGEQATITGTTAEKVRWEHLHVTAPTPRQFNQQILQELEGIILRCLEKIPARRFDSAMELLSSLENVLSWMIENGINLTSSKDLKEASENTKQPISKQKSWLWLGGIAVILMISLVAVASGAREPPKTLPQNSTATSTPTILIPTHTFAVPLTHTPTVVQKPTNTPTSSPTPTPVIQACSPSLTCTQIGQTCLSPKDGMKMVCVPSGEFEMGGSEAEAAKYFVITNIVRNTGEFGHHSVFLDAFWIDQTEVTNAMFAKFISETGYKTTAEQAGRSYVFSYDFSGEKDFPYWKELPGASWLHPFGFGSDIVGKDNFPVVSVSWIDAYQYCQWANKDLPTEAQWEKAGKGDHDWMFPWGNQLPTSGTALANFADLNLRTDYSQPQYNDGYEFSAPVDSFPDGRSPYGVYNMSGNVMEWVEDMNIAYAALPAVSNPRNLGDPADSFFVERAIRGGSWERVLSLIRVNHRDSMIGGGRRDDLGFRCASKKEQ